MVEMVDFPTVDSKIIQENLQECWNVFMKNFLNYSLECGWSCFQTKNHYYIYKDSPFCNKGCLFLNIRMHSYLIISVESAQKTIHFMTSDRIENTICKW